MPKNAWTKLKRRPRITINEWSRFPVDTKRGPAILVQYDRPGKPWRSYQQFIYPDGAQEWRYEVSKRVVTEEMLEKYWRDWNSGLIQRCAEKADWSKQSRAWSVTPRKNSRR